MRHHLTTLCCAIVALAAALTGCGPDIDRPDPIQIDRATPPEYFINTVGQRAFVSGGDVVLVQGVGLVVGLDGTGSTTHPPGLRNQMLKVLAALRLPTSILSDPDTAAVYVSGYIPPGSRESERFDLLLMAAPNTQTTSLEGGRLLKTDLFRVENTRAGLVTGSNLAYAEGELFVSPFQASTSPTERSPATHRPTTQPSFDGVRPIDGPPAPSAPPADDALPEPPTEDSRRTDPRIGWILGGGECRYARSFFLNLHEPSERTAQQLVRHINARFPGAAEGNIDPGIIDLKVPEAYAENKQRFLQVVGSIYLVENPAARERRMRDLVDALGTDPNPSDLVAAIEAFGRPALPLLEPVLRSPNGRARYYAAEAMCRLDDAGAVGTMQQFALDDRSPFQEAAIGALGELPNGEGAPVIEQAFNAASPAVRIAAYKAMRRAAPGMLDFVTVPGRLELAVVPTRAEPFVHVSRQMAPRVVIFGNVHLEPPVLVDTPRVLASARSGENALALMSKVIGPRSVIRLPLRLAPVLSTMVAPPVQDPDTGRPLGLDLTYSDVIALLDRASTSGALGVPIVYEQPSIDPLPGDEEWVGPDDTSGDIIVPDR